MDSFKLIFDSLYPVMTLFAKKILIDTIHAEDITQEVFIELWNQRTKFESYEHIKAFLYLAIKNKCLNHNKHLNVKDKYKHHIDDSTLHTFDDNDIIESEVINNLYKSINQLPEQQKQVIIYTLQGLTNKEIAQELDISTNTVKFHKKSAYQFLRNNISSLPLLLLLL